MADAELVLVRVVAKEDSEPLWLNLNAVVGFRPLAEGGTVLLLVGGGGLQIQESLDVLMNLPMVQVWQVPDPPPSP